MRLSRLHVEKEAHEDGIWATGWSANDVLLTGSVDESVMLWSEEGDSLQRVHTFMGHNLGVISLTAHPKGTYAATSSLDSLVRVWDIEDRQTTLQILEMPPSECWCIDFSPAADRMLLSVAGGAAENISLWDVQGDARKVNSMKLPKKESPDMKQHNRPQFVLSTVFSPDGRKVAACGMDGLVAIFDVETGKLVGQMSDHNKPVRTMTFTQDSRMLLSGSDDMHIHMYDSHNASLVEAMSGHEAWVLSLSCHPDGAHVASGGSDSKVKLWELSSRRAIQTVNEHNDQVWGVEFRKDGTRLASVSDDGSVAIHACG